MKFKINEKGNLIGYRWDVRGTLTETDRAGALSMESLTNDQVLYICNDPVTWFPDHLPRKEYVLYEIEFKPLKEKKLYFFQRVP